MADTHILTALYADHATAERAAERLRAVGVPEDGIELHGAAEGDVDPGGHRAGDGLFGALSTLLVPESDLHAYERGLGRGGAVLIARDVPHERVSDAAAALEEDAVEIDDEPVDRRRTKAHRHGGRLRAGDRRRRSPDRRADRHEHRTPRPRLPGALNAGPRPMRGLTPARACGLAAARTGESALPRTATFHDLDGRSVFITGGGSGIGASLTEGFVAQGCRVAFVQRSDAIGLRRRARRPPRQRAAVHPLRRHRHRRAAGGDGRGRRGARPDHRARQQRRQRRRATRSRATRSRNGTGAGGQPPPALLHHPGGDPRDEGGRRRRDRQLLVDLLHDGRRRLSRPTSPPRPGSPA